MLAWRLLELNVSAIVDLYEMQPGERRRFVRLFFEAMVNAPKELYHNVLVILDEAHMFAPEKGESEATGAVIDLASRGRKRFYSLVLATQRISKLAKDAVAECNNKLIGRASLDIDRKRAAEELGMTAKEDILALRTMKPGEFFAFGPAISDEVIKIKIGDVKTSIPRAGSVAKVTPPTPAIKKILGKLADLPHEAEQEAKTISELKAELVQLKREKPKLGVSTNPLDKEKIEAWQRVAAAQAKDLKLWFKWADAMNFTFEEFVKKVKALSMPIRFEHKLLNGGAPIDVFIQKDIKVTNVKRSEPSAYDPGYEIKTTGDLTGPEQKILDAIALSESIGVPEPEQTAVAFMAGYKFGGGGFNNPRGALKSKGLIEYRGKNVVLTEIGRNSAHVSEQAFTTADLHSRVLRILPGPEKKLLTVLLEIYPNDISGEELAERSGYKFGTGGFNNPKGRLRSLGLVEYPSQGRIRARKILFID